VICGDIPCNASLKCSEVLGMMYDAMCAVMYFVMCGLM